MAESAARYTFQATPDHVTTSTTGWWEPVCCYLSAFKNCRNVHLLVLARGSPVLKPLSRAVQKAIIAPCPLQHYIG